MPWVRRCIQGRGKLLMHKNPCWGFGASHSAHLWKSSLRQTSDWCKSWKSLFISYTSSMFLTLGVNLSVWTSFPSAGIEDGSHMLMQMSSRASCLHHVPMTEKGSSKVLLSLAHTMGDTDGILISLSTANTSSCQDKDLQGSSWTVFSKDIKQKILPKISCLQLSVYTWYFKATFRKTCHLGCGCGISCPPEQLPWPATSACCTPGLKVMLVQTRAKEMQKAHCWCCKLCSSQISVQSYTMPTFITLIDRL